jgi:hypothetical protein
MLSTPAKSKVSFSSPKTPKISSAVIGLLYILASLRFSGAEDRLVVPRRNWAETLAEFAIPDPASLDEKIWERTAQELWKLFPVETDWLLQDAPERQPGETVNFRRDLGWYFVLRTSFEGFARSFGLLLEKPLKEVPPPEAAKLRSRFENLVKEKKPGNDPAWLQLYEEACQARRLRRLQNLIELAPSFVFAKHFTMGGSHYAYTEGLSNAWNERHFIPGTALCLATWDGSSFRVETLLEDANGVIRDPDVSFDGSRILFAWKKSDRRDDYHLYEMDLPSRQIRQLTHGLGVADYEGCYLPDGSVVFNSTRCIQAVDCWWTEVSNLFLMPANGNEFRRLTFDQVHTNFPVPTEDGRIVYTRWEYNDRGQIFVQALMEMNPDGTGQRGLYGGNSWFPTTILHARPIPGTQQFLAIATGHHTRQPGKLILIDPRRGREENLGVQLIAPYRPTLAVRVDAYGQEGELFQYPYPLSPAEFLVGYHPVGWSWANGWGVPFAIYWMDLQGRRELLVWDEKLPCNRPVPLRPRPAFRRPDRTPPGPAAAVCYVQNVYHGPGLHGVPLGTARWIRVVALDFRAVAIGKNKNQGPAGAAMISTPVAIGNGSWDVKIILGETPVEADGSACFEVPPCVPIYFQILDERGFAIQSMRSWVSLQPGEKLGCIGCHEHKNTAPPVAQRLPLAFRRDSEKLVPFYGPPRGFSFRKEIQPILDAKCISCHDGRQADDLTDAEVVDPVAKRRWSQAYLSLTHSQWKDGDFGWVGDPDHPVVSWIHAQSAPPMLPPYSAGAARSKLFAMLTEGEGGHPVVELSQEQIRKLAAWIDLAVPFCGDYLEAHAWTPQELVIYQSYLDRRRELTGLPALVTEVLRLYEFLNR